MSTGWRPNGMLMSPNNGGSSSPRSRPPTGEVNSVGGGSGSGGDEGGSKEVHDKPMEVVFTKDTFRKMITWTLGPLLLTLIGAISAFFFFYHKTNVHLSDPTIHLTRGERSKLETKEEAHKERKKIKTEITGHFDVKVREIRVEQREQCTILGNQLKEEQAKRLNQILTEVKKARQDIKSQ